MVFKISAIDVDDEIEFLGLDISLFIKFTVFKLLK